MLNELIWSLAEQNRRFGPENTRAVSGLGHGVIEEPSGLDSTLRAPSSASDQRLASNAYSDRPDT
jgi:hypothetical protein